MGTTWSVKLAVPRSTDLHALHAEVQAQLGAVVAQMSNWEADSDLSRYNTASAGSWQVLPGGFWTVLCCALDIARDSDGAYDPTVGPLVDAWGFGPSGRGTPPQADAIAAARECVGWRRIELDTASRRVLQPGGTHLDLCAIAKGHAVDAVASHLKSRGVAAALVEVGGELYGYGRKPDGTPWRVIVEAWSGDEYDDSEPRVLALDGHAVATSGDRWHRYEHDGRQYSHTLDPRTGTPVRDAPAAVTVIARDAMHADGWATALTVLGSDAGYDFACARGLAARFVDTRGDGRGERMTPAFIALLAP
ncbi:FAD:protein FMN transferase [Lysobacter cavernae]|uniref:FAD:protein FMN transferase n=1 Tax=Lysobacter cavernae TaxID=1685901 RepID=A0ABV7RPQ8_9GAMM